MESGKHLNLSKSSHKVESIDYFKIPTVPQSVKVNNDNNNNSTLHNGNLLTELQVDYVINWYKQNIKDNLISTKNDSLSYIISQQLLKIIHNKLLSSIETDDNKEHVTCLKDAAEAVSKLLAQYSKKLAFENITTDTTHQYIFDEVCRQSIKLLRKVQLVMIEQRESAELMQTSADFLLEESANQIIQMIYQKSLPTNKQDSSSSELTSSEIIRSAVDDILSEAPSSNEVTPKIKMNQSKSQLKHLRESFSVVTDSPTSGAKSRTFDMGKSSSYIETMKSKSFHANTQARTHLSASSSFATSRTNSDTEINKRYLTSSSLSVASSSSSTGKKSVKKKPSIVRSISKDSLSNRSTISAKSSQSCWLSEAKDITWFKSSILKDQNKSSPLHSSYSIIIILDPATQKPHFMAMGLGNQAKDKSQLIGSGAYGKVKVAQDIATKEWFAVKMMTVDKTESRTRYNYGPMRKEAENLRLCGIDAFFIPRPAIDEKPRQGIIFMKYLDGNPMNKLDHLSRPNHWWLTLALNTAIKIQTVHKNNLIHRDIKDENIIVSPKNANVELIDVGHSNTVSGELKINNCKIGTSAPFLAPELKMSASNFAIVEFNEKTEAYALGITLMRTLKLGAVKSNQNDPIDLSNSVIKDPELRATIYKFISERLLHEDPAKRATIQEAIEFFTKQREHYFDLHPEALTSKIAFVDINELHTLNATNYQNMINKLKQYDEVFLLDQNKKCQVNDYIKDKQELSAKGVVLGNKVIRAKDSKQSFENFLKDATSVTGNENCSITYITTNTKVKSKFKSDNVKVKIVEKIKPSRSIITLFRKNSHGEQLLQNAKRASAKLAFFKKKQSNDADSSPTTSRKHNSKN